MHIVHELRSLKRKLNAGQPAHHSVEQITSELPIRYRTHLLGAWKRYIASRNTYVLLNVVEQLISHLESDRPAVEHQR
jgi:hypothetical protein